MLQDNLISKNKTIEALSLEVATQKSLYEVEQERARDFSRNK